MIGICVCNLKELYASKNLTKSQAVETYFTFVNCIIFHYCGITVIAMPAALNDWTIQQITAQKNSQTLSNLKLHHLRRRKLPSEACVLLLKLCGTFINLSVTQVLKAVLCHR
jgi:hypothetical protein